LAYCSGTQNKLLLFIKKTLDGVKQTQEEYTVLIRSKTQEATLSIQRHPQVQVLAVGGAIFLLKDLQTQTAAKSFPIVQSAKSS